MNTLKILLLTISAGICLAQRPAPPATELKAYLGLSDAQVTSLQSIQRDTMQASRAVMEQIRTKHEELEALLDKGTDATAAGKLLLEIKVLRTQVETARTSLRTQASAILTADQRSKLKALEGAVKLQAPIQQATMLNLLAPGEEVPHMGPFGRPPARF